MFPNVRLMIVAILAAIAGIGCGLGLFATFRVNHEPLARLAEGSAPLQLAVDNLALGSQARMPLQARLSVSGGADLTSVPAIIPTPNVAPSAAVSAAPTAPANPAPALSAERAGADSASAGDAQQPADAVTSLAIAAPAEQSSVTPDAGTPTQQQPVAAVPDQQAAFTAQDRPSAATAPDQQAEATQDRPPAAAAPDQQAAATAQDRPPAAAAPNQQTAARTAAINAAAEDQQPAAKPAESAGSKAPKPRVTATRALPARHAVRKVRARRTTATIAAQPSYQYSQPTYSQPAYTWADGTAQASQPINRVQIKRHRTAKKVAPAAQTNSAPAAAGLSHGQY